MNAVTPIFRVRKEFEDIKCPKAFCFCSFYVRYPRVTSVEM